MSIDLREMDVLDLLRQLPEDRDWDVPVHTEGHSGDHTVVTQ